MFNFGILGLNARNLHYIKKHNPKKGIRFVNDKYKTKEFLSKRGVPVPITYARIVNGQDLFQKDFLVLPKKTFVVKPNKGSKGNGIFIIKNIKEHEENNEIKIKQEKKPSLRYKKIGYYSKKCIKILGEITSGAIVFKEHLTNTMYKIGDTRIDDDTFKKKLYGIIDGQYTLGDNPDTILVEERLIPGHGFEEYCEFGLADMRVIMFNLIPVAAMLRMPTITSEGKANLAQGGIGLGIDIGTGAVTTICVAGKTYTNNFPKIYKHLQHKKIPFRDDILLYSANAQYFLNIGYIGLDWVISKDGPKLLEVNGRVGIEIQNIIQQPLAKLMEKIYDLKVASPEKGVEIAKSLFTQAKSTNSVAKIIFLSQKALLETHHTTEHISIEAIANVNPNKKRNYCGSSLLKKLGSQKNISLILPDSNIKTTINLYVDEDIQGNKITLGQDTIQDYLIKPIHKTHAQSKIFGPNKIIAYEIDELQLFDQKIGELQKRIKLSKCLKPINYLEEFDTFVSNKGNYNPIFEYNYPTNQQIHVRKDEHKKMLNGFLSSNFSSDFASILHEKIIELGNKIQLVSAYKYQNFDTIDKMQKYLYGDIDKTYLLQAQGLDKKEKHRDKKDMGAILNINEVYDKIVTYLAEAKITNVSVETSTSALSRIAVVYKESKAVIRLLSNTRTFFRERELLSKLIHEVDVHLQRYLHGSKTGRQVLKHGTAGYIVDEEGLAIWESEKYLQQYIPDFSKLNIYQNYIIVEKSQHLDFASLADYINTKFNNEYFRSNKLQALFNRTLRHKKGVQRTQTIHPGAAFIKDKIYLDGYKKIESFIAKGGDIEKLMIGKIKISDIDKFY